MDYLPFIQENLRSTGWFRPELALTCGAVLLFLLDLVWRDAANRVSRLSVATLAVLGVSAALLAAQPTDAQMLFNGMIANDALATFFKWLFLAAAALTVVISAQAKDIRPERSGEFQAILLTVVLGLFLMASSANLLMIYLSLELVSIGSYILTGYKKGDRKGVEASLKYVIYGGVASGVMLFGMSYLYGLTGTADLPEMARRIGTLSQTMAQAQAMGGQAAIRLTLILAVIFVLAGIGYKVAAVPWHMWCPDVYEGAPTPFTAFLSVGPKAAGFAVALRFFYGAFAAQPGTPLFDAQGLGAAVAGIPWPAVIGVVAAITMTLGNLSALGQTNLKRLLAYSSIAHAGYTLMGLSALSKTGMQSVMIYMSIYLIMNLGAFLAVIVVAQTTGSESIYEYRGLGKRAPLAATAFAVFLFSLTGIPPFAGFIGKYYLFLAVLERASGPAGNWWMALAICGALNSAVSLYYYARVLKAMFLESPYRDEPMGAAVGHRMLLGAFSAAVLVFGVAPGLLVQWTERSLQLFRG